MYNQQAELQNEFLTRVIPLAWNELSRVDKNELVHIWIMGRRVGGPVPNYTGDWNAAFTVVQRLQHIQPDMVTLFWKSLPPIYDWIPEDLVLRVMRVYGYKG